MFPVVTASADELRPMNLAVEGWTYAPVEDEGVVTALVALRDSDQLPAGIIGLYCFDRGDGTWGVKAWTSASCEEVVLYLAGLLDQAIGDVAEALIDLPLDREVLEDPEMAGVAPEPFGAGLLEGDPLESAVAGSSDPMAVLEVLEMLNYPAVSKVSVAGTAGEPTVGGACADISVDDWLSLLRGAFESEISGQDALAEAFDAAVSAACTFCVYWSSSTITSTPWACGSWSVVDGPNPGAFPDICVCEHRRLATRTQTKVTTTLHWDCTFTTCTQTRSCAAWQHEWCNTNGLPIGGGYTCIGVTPCTIPAGTECSPTGGAECSSWWPPCP